MHGSRISTGIAFTLALAACGSSGGGSSTSGTPALCTSYCSQMATTCIGADTQYTGLLGTCETYCTANAWPTGGAGDSATNTLNCRITHVGLAAAAGDRTMHCGHAGPTGGDACGTWCDNYCYLALRNCTGPNAAGLGFTDLTSCKAACAGFATGGPIDAPTGNTVQCRIYHAGAAAYTPDPQCGNAQVVSSATVGGASADGPCN